MHHFVAGPDRENMTIDSTVIGADPADADAPAKKGVNGASPRPQSRQFNERHLVESFIHKIKQYHQHLFPF